MDESKPQRRTPTPQPSPAPKPERGAPTPPKPDKNVVVPKYDLLTEGRDPAKLKKQ